MNETAPIRVVHPVPVRALPRGHANEKLLFDRGETYLRLPTVDERGMRQVLKRSGHPMETTSVHEGEGKHWVRLSYARKGLDEQWSTTPMPLSDFVRYLGGDGLGGREDCLDGFVTRSPLVAWSAPRRDASVFGVAWDGANRGTNALDRSGLRVVEDGSAMAEAALRRMLGNLRVSGNHVYVPFEGPFRLVVPRRPYHRQSGTLSLRTTTRPRAWLPRHEPHAFACSAWRGEEVGQLAAATVRWAGEKRNVLVTGEGLAEYRSPGEAPPDVVLHANDFPSRTLSCLARPSGPGLSDDAMASLLPWVMRGSIGAIAHDEAEEVLVLCRSLLDGHDDAADPATVAGSLCAYADMLALPSIRAVQERAVDEDGEVLSGLGMGGP